MKYPFYQCPCALTTPYLTGLRRWCRPAEQAFTLVELVTVLAIIAILSSIAVPSYLSWLPKYRLNSAADDMLVLFQNARLRAIKENANVYIDFDPDGDENPDGNYIVYVDNGQDGQEKTIAAGRLSRNVEIEEVTFNNHLMHFSHRGLSSGGHIIISNQRGEAKKIVTRTSGRIRLETLS